MKKVKVGVIDTGVFHNRDLDGKIVGSYDINSYNTAGDVRGKIAGNMHYYIFSKDGSYLFLQRYQRYVGDGRQWKTRASPDAKRIG